MNDIANSVLNLSGFKVVEMTGVRPVEVQVEYVGLPECPSCGSRSLRKKDQKERRIRHVSIGNRAMILILKTIKFCCSECKKYFWQRFQGVLPRMRNTEAFREQVSDLHHKGITAKDLGVDHGLGHATVTRWYIHYLERRNLELKGAALPKILGIDEHFFTRRRGYATTLCNLRTHRVFDVVLGRSEASLEGFFRRCKGKENVQVAVMDLSENYRNIIRKFLPKAKIVADRFHVIRLANHHFMATWKLIDPEGRRSIGLTKLMRQHEWNLTPDKHRKLQRYLVEHPALKAIYDFKQELCQLLLLKRQNQRQFKRLIPTFLAKISLLQTSHFTPLVTLGNTLQSWQEEILRMLRFTKTNGITEGFHNKMEMMSRRAFGFRNFENYRLKVRVACA
ncbi:MAG: ISL3 family transposase [Candidatus Methylumidiphilus sp.]